MKPLFSSKRLDICQGRELFEQDKVALADAVTRLLTPEVVKALPESFHERDNRRQALNWLELNLAQSELFAVVLKCPRQVIGFILVHGDRQSRLTSQRQTQANVNIGYLFGEKYWRQGFAVEMLTSLIRYYQQLETVGNLYAGVQAGNIASARLLQECGFSLVKGPDRENLCYRLCLQPAP